MDSKKVLDSANFSDLKFLAEKSMTNGDFTTAFIYWSQAIRLEPENPDLYFQRSQCFLKQEQFYFALQDSNRLLGLDSFRGLQRKAQVFWETQNYAEALPHYQECLRNATDSDSKIEFQDRILQCQLEIEHEKRTNRQYPYLGAAIGIIIAAVAIVLIRESMTHPIYSVLFVLFVSGFGYFVTFRILEHIKESKKDLLNPPIDVR